MDSTEREGMTARETPAPGPAAQTAVGGSLAGSPWWAWTSVVVLILGLASIAMIIATKRIGERRILEDIPHERAVVEIQSSLASAHLFLEGFFAVDPSADLTEAWRLLARVEELAQALLEGGVLPQGEEISAPFKDPGLRTRVEAVRQLLLDFRRVARDRVEDRRQGLQQPGSEQLYDQVLGELLSEAAALETAVKERTATNQESADDFFRVILLAWILLIGLAVSGLVTREVQRRRAERALQSSEQRLAATLRSIADGVITTDGRGRITFINEVAAELLRRDPRKILGRALSEVHRTSAVVVAPDGGVMPPEPVEPGTVAPTECLLHRGDAEPLPIEESAAPIRDTRGRATGQVLVLRDTTPRREAEAALREIEAQQRQSQKLEAVGRLAGGLAHDINNYLATITSESEQVKLFLAGDPAVAAKMNGILQAVDKASSLLKRMLAFSRRQPASLRVVSLTEIARELAPMLQRLLGDNTRLDLRLDEDLEPVEVDPAQLEQVLVNLVVNAREAMPAGGTITVRTATRELAVRPAGEADPGVEARVVLSVADTGCGIDPEDLDMVFEPFFTTKTGGDNSGLGLSTVYGIVNQCGGEIWIDSEVGTGTEFVVHFPVSDKPLGEARRGKPPEPASPARSRRILLVEDNQALRRSLGSMLESLGHRVEAAASGEQALEIYESHRGFDLAVTDFVLPGINGQEMLERIWRTSAGFPAIVISAHASPSSLERLRTEAHVSFLAKPFGASRLNEAIEELLRRRQPAGQSSAGTDRATTAGTS